MKKQEKTFFDEENRLSILSELGDNLEQLNKTIDWEDFRETLELVLNRKAPSKQGGRPPYDGVLMFKILVIREIHQLSDESTEFMINDRLTFQRFLGLELCDKVPDAKTIWQFRESLIEAKAMEKLFDKFYEHLKKKNIIAHKGSIVDASFVQVPIQRNSGEENKLIREGKEVEGWSEDKKSQKDTDAKWAMKRGKSYFGYKNHINIDTESKLIKTCEVTSGETHDSQVIEDLLTAEDCGQPLYGDSAYRSQEIEKTLKSRKIKSKIHEKGYRGQPLTKKQKESNRIKSKTRVRVEHVFGQMRTSMKLDKLRCIGIKRVTGIVHLINLCYNMLRYKHLVKKSAILLGA